MQSDVVNQISGWSLFKLVGGTPAALGAGSLLSGCGEDAARPSASYVNRNLNFFFYTVLVESLQCAHKDKGCRFKTTDANDDAGSVLVDAIRIRRQTT
jgi:hypothetical protein